MIKCGECGYENMDGLDYCPDGCGARITDAAAPAAAVGVEWRVKGMCSKCGHWVYLPEGAALTHCGRPLTNVTARGSADKLAYQPRPELVAGGLVKGMCSYC